MRSSRRGFTLTQIMISMTLLAVIITSVIAMLIAQTRFVSRVNSDVTALDQITAAQEMLANEVASLPAGALAFARGDSMAFRMPLSWGVICGPIDRHQKASGSNKKKKSGAITYSNTLALALEPAATALNSPTPNGFAIAPDGETFQYVAVTNWSSVGLVQNQTAGVSCINQPPQAAGKSGNFRSEKSAQKVSASQIGNIDDYWSSDNLLALAAPTVPAERSLIFTYALVSYYFKTDGTAGQALFRSIGGVAERLAGPFTSQAAFSYRLQDGSTASTYAGGSLGLVRAVRANLPALRVQRGAVSADTVTVNPWLYLVNAR